MLAVRRISEQAVFPKWSLDHIFAGIFDTIAQNFCRTAVFQTFENLVCLTILLSCNFKGLVFDFYLNRKRNKCWLAAYSWPGLICVPL